MASLILGEIRRGGMGVVYRAHDTRLNREVALEVLPPELVGDSDRKRRSVQEAQAAASLSHPHIAAVYEIDEANGMSFITMELIDVRKPSDVLEGRPLSIRRALELTSEIAEGLARAHERNVVHRDIKPANIVVTTDGHAKIIDVGLAKLVEPITHDPQAVTAAGNTSPGVVLGTTAYMSPEQARGDTVDHRTPISFHSVSCCSRWWMAAGRFGRRRRSRRSTRLSRRRRRHSQARLQRVRRWAETSSASSIAVSKRIPTIATRLPATCVRSCVD